MVIDLKLLSYYQSVISISLLFAAAAIHYLLLSYYSYIYIYLLLFFSKSCMILLLNSLDQIALIQPKFTPFDLKFPNTFLILGRSQSFQTRGKLDLCPRFRAWWIYIYIYVNIIVGRLDLVDHL